MLKGTVFDPAGIGDLWFNVRPPKEHGNDFELMELLDF